MATLTEFQRKMARVAAKVPNNVDKVVRKVALAVDQTVVLATPVDTGRARANFITSLNTPSASTVPAPASAGAGANEALAQGRAVIGAYNGDFDTSVHITNNLPYILALDRGSSAQAPTGYVKRAVLAGARAVRGAKVLD